MNNKLSKIEAARKILDELEKTSWSDEDCISSLREEIAELCERVKLVEERNVKMGLTADKVRKPYQKVNGTTLIENLKLSTPIINALNEYGLHTVNDLKTHSYEDILGIWRIGTDRAKEILEMCRENNIQLKQV